MNPAQRPFETNWLRAGCVELAWKPLAEAVPPFLNLGIVSTGLVRHVLDKHQRGQRDHSYWLWSLLILELWSRESSLRVS